jgi:amidase
MSPPVDEDRQPFLDAAGAFVPHGRFEIEGSPTGPLHGLTFAVKDLFDIAGRVTGAGNPRWLETHTSATVTAPVVTALLNAGARMIGKTITDELAYSLNGDNIHYGTPKNIRVPCRVPGGSSSGSAAAVAADLCDFALGTDTGGSVRIPASYCGILGIRTTQGFVSAEGVVPLMPSFDTVGWFARDLEVFARVGDVLLPKHAAPKRQFSKLIVASEAISILDPELIEPIRGILRTIAGQFAEFEEIVLSGVQGLEEWRQIFRLASAHETWKIHGVWVTAEGDSLAPPIRERFAFAASVSDEQAMRARDAQSQIRDRLRAVLGGNSVLFLPTAPGPAPKLDARGEEVELFRQRAQRLTSIAGLSGFPQITLPVLEREGAPVGVSLLGPEGSDRQLLDLAAHLFPYFAGHTKNI